MNVGLPSEVIDQFVKATRTEKKTSSEATVYGTTVKEDGVIKVRIDGSEAENATPIVTTTNLTEGERVTVLIKDHVAIVTGNVSSPSATSGDMKNISDEITELEIVVADKVDTEQLNAEKARIDTLETTTAEIKDTLKSLNIETDYIEVNKKLTAVEAEIDELQATTLTTEVANSKFATIENLETTNTKIHNLETTYASFESATATKFEALDATISDLEAGQITTEELDAKYATIAALDVEKGRINDLEAEVARIDNLEADVAEIDTLIYGSATGTTIQTSFANAVIAQLGNAQIKSAMIDNVSANKINAGDINTNKVRVVSEDGKLVISDETIQISDSTRVRVQIGKDSSGDYSINIWDAEGNLMFSEGGITDSAIKEAIIRNDMVSDTANIAAHKLDIDSLFEEINGSEKTIKSTRIYLDDQAQTLDVAFESVTTDIEEIQNGMTSQGTQITAIQGQIASKIWQQDINTAINEVGETTDNLSSQYEEMQQDLDGMSATVANHTSQISKKADSTEVTEVNEKVTALETNLDGFQSSVSSTYVTKTEFNDLEIGGRNLYKRTGNFDSSYWNSYASLEPYENDSTYKQAVCYGDANGYLLSTLTSVQGFDFSDTTKTWTISAMMKGTNDDQMISVTLDADRIGWYGTKVTNGSWKKMVYTFTGSKSLITFRFTGTNVSADSPVYIAQLKVEEGNKATDWTPAPEDVQSEIDAAQALAEAAQATANQNAKDMASIVNSFNNDISNLKTQIDGNITTWFYEGPPTNNNKPTVEWTTTEDKKVHLGDLYFDTITGYSYRWQKEEDDTYLWHRITDTDVTKALSDAQTAKDTADQKRRVFYTTPVPPYDKGDLWVQGSSGDILRCATTKTSGQSYVASDWVAASKYTDDTTANVAKNAAATAQSTADKAQSDINNLAIGGRNLIIRSQSTQDYYYDQNGNLTASGGAGTAAMTSYISIKPNTQYTFSRSAGGGDYFRFNWYDADKNYIGRKAITEIGSNAAGTFTWTSPSNAYYLLVSYPWDEASEAKLERGNKASDWSPAPEDVEHNVETRVSSAETKITQNTDNITSIANRTTTVENKFANYSTTEQMNSAIQQKANSITSSVAATYTTKSEFGKLSVGGTNLLLNSNFANGMNYWTPVGAETSVISDDTFDQCLTLLTTVAGTSMNRIYADTYTNFTHKAGVEYTLSFWAKASEATTMQTNTAGSGNPVDHSLTTTWQKFVKTYTTAITGSITFWPNVANVTIYLANVKLELGNVVTDWTPAPGDMATSNDLSSVQSDVNSTETRVSSAETLIQQLSYSISMLVTDGNGQSLMTQTDDGWTFSTSEIQNMVDTTSENLDVLTNEVGDINSAVGILQQAVDDLGILNEYVKITTYEDEPCIELGETDSDFKLLITNTRIMFMEGTDVPAYITNQSLHIKKAVIEEELQQGEFVWKARSNGNLGLIWKGATS